MEEPHFLNIQKSYQILFSYAGSEESKESIGNQITGEEQIYSLSWRRDNKKFPYPFQIRFTTKFVKYNLHKALNPKDEEIKHFKKVQFLHIFFINCSSAEEYRNKIRHEVSEWFSNLSSIEKSQWLIVFDSKIAREKKNRGQIMERIKSDFSSNYSRVIEVYDRASLSVLESIITSSILVSIETYATILESFLTYEKERYTTPNFNLLSYSNGFFILMHFYWSIGLLETVLTQLDDQKNFLDDIVESYTKNKDIYEWGKENETFNQFELLSSLMDSKRTVDFNSLAIIPYLRKYILAQQIMTSFAIYFNKSKKAINSDVNENLERLAILKIDISSIILNGLYETIRKINSDINLLSLNIDSLVYNIWIVLIILECFEFASILTPQMFSPDLGSNNICLLLKMKCDAMKKTWEMMKQKCFILTEEEIKILPVHGPFFGNEINLLSKFKECLTNNEDFQLYMESTFVEAIFEMKKLNYFRNAIYVSYQLADIYLKMDNPESSLRIKIETIKDVLHAGECHCVLADFMMKEVVDEIVLSTDSDFYTKELYLFCYYGINYCQNEEEKKRYQKLLLDLSLSQEVEKYELPLWLKRQIPFKINYKYTSNYLIKCTADETNTFSFSLSTDLPLEIENLKVITYFRPVNRENLASFAKRRLLFMCKFTSDEIVNRFGCLHKGGSTPVEEISKDKLISFEGEFVDNEEHIFRPKIQNSFTTFLRFSQTGLYMLEYVEIVLRENLIFTLKNKMLSQNVNDAQLLEPLFKNVFVLVDNELPNIVIEKERERTLLAGVVQKVHITLHAGSKSVKDSILLLGPKSGTDDLIEFKGSDGHWKNSVEISIKNMKAREIRIIEIFLYLPTARLSFSNWEEPPVTKKILIKWMETNTVMKLGFRPIINVITTTSIMDNKALFEMEIHRKHGKNLIIQPIDAQFQHICKDTTVDPLDIDIKRLNTDINEQLDIHSVYSVIWLLTNNHKRVIPDINPTLKYKLIFKYKVLKLNSDGKTYVEIPFERDYQLLSEFNFALPAIEYEICAQLLSEHPQSVICRAQNTCEMVLSVRSISRVVETIIVGLDADPAIWKITSKFKQLTIKDSGLGQIAFSIIPLVVGFLPYPNITVFSFNKEHGQPEKMKESVDHYPQVIGKQICTFSRTKGRQIHVLGQITLENASSTTSLPALNHKSHNKGDSNISSSRSSLRSSARQKLQKFFDK